jgi:hypothetical protein
MPGQFFSNAERERLQRFPSEVAPADLIAFFRLSESDLAQILVTVAPHNQLGFALQLRALRPRLRPCGPYRCPYRHVFPPEAS